MKELLEFLARELVDNPDAVYPVMGALYHRRDIHASVDLVED